MRVAATSYAIRPRSSATQRSSSPVYFRPGARLKHRKRFLSALERLQDGFGDLNDIAVHEKRIAALGARDQRLTPSRLFAAGLLTGREHARIEAAMRAATNAYADLVEVKRFW